MAVSPSIGIDQHFERSADLLLQPCGADARLCLHEPRLSVLAHILRDRVRQRIGRGPCDRRVGEAPDTVELRFVQERQQLLELGVGLAGEARDERGADRDFGADRAPRPDAGQGVLGVGRPLHELQDARARVLERDVEVGQQLAFGHQRNDVVDVRIRIDVVQPHPHAHFAQRLRELDHLRLHRPALPEPGPVLDVHAVGAGVLRDDQQFPDARLHQVFRFREHLADRARDEVAAHRRNDAERAAMVAAFADLQIRVVRRRQLDTDFAN